MKHKHHIIPKHMGGTDSPDNLIELTVEEHSQAHFDLYEQYGKIEDLCAYYMLSGKNKDPKFYHMRGKIGGSSCAEKRKLMGLTGPELFYGRPVTEEEIKINSSKGGKIQGNKNVENNHMKTIREIVNYSELGKKNSEICRQKKVNSFFDPELRKKVAIEGGKIQGKKNAENGHLKRIAQLPNPRAKGKCWITNGIDSTMMSKDDIIPDGYRKGRVQKRK